MIDMTPARFASIVREVEGLGPLESFSAILPTGHPHRAKAEDCLRVFAWSKPDDTVEISLDRYQAEESEWFTAVAEWDEAGNPIVFAVRDVERPEELANAVDWIVSRAFEEELERESHPGADLLWWVWGQ